jgi:formylglycine-generating enzyme required for sulfatase activity
MVFVSGTEFFMGVDTDDPGIEAGAFVKAASFSIDRLEVTVTQYLDCFRSNECGATLPRGRDCNAEANPSRPDHPMNCVAWEDADRFCRSRGKRLPTSVEWELAARGTDRRVYPWGNELPGEQLCWQGGRDKRRTTTCPAGSYPQGASPYGLLDMAGNVAEWTSTVADGAFPAPSYVVRGGAYLMDPMLDEPEWGAHRADRADSANSSVHRPDIGFRCAK